MLALRTALRPFLLHFHLFGQVPASLTRARRDAGALHLCQNG
jgi:hypothetical protein